MSPVNNPTVDDPNVLPPSSAAAKDQFKSGYKAFVSLFPLRSGQNGWEAIEEIKLEVSGNKTLLGLAEGENWTFSTDNPEQEIAEVIAGKFGGVSPLSYEVPYDPVLLQKLVSYAKNQFTVRTIYDDEQLEFTYKIYVYGCFLTTPGSTSGTANNSAPTMTVTLQPRGGGKLEDTFYCEKTLRIEEE